MSHPFPNLHRRLGFAVLPGVLAAALAGPACANPAMPAAAAAPAGAICPPLLQHTLPRLQDEKPQPLCQWAGQVLLIVNTASHCGFTHQYKGLEALHQRYHARGFSVLGFPSNDFRQEKASNREIAEFCESNFGVRFPMFAASSVRGEEANPVFRALAQESRRPPSWNFFKYVVDRQGRVVASFGSSTSPDDARLRRAIEEALDRR